MPGEKLQINTRTIVEPLQMRKGDDLEKVTVSGIVFGQQYQMEGGVVDFFAWCGPSPPK